ncbi:MAG: SCO family protein [Opitutae bacterium]|nr:SCO family protein [Opitutae bacterium]
MAGLMLPGCAKQERAATGTASAAPTRPGEKRYPLKGEIVAVQADKHILVVQHEAIPDYMPAMTMEFKVGRGDVANAKAGQRIRGELVYFNGELSLEKIWPDDTQTARQLDAAAKALAQDTAMRGKEAYREVGEVAPDFTLLDQEGRTITAGHFRGKQVMLNFIFTRCPIATMCPAATQHMMALQAAAKQAGIANVEFVSISLDPEYDTPGVLKEYAEARGIDTANFTFLTGPDTAVRQLLAQLGILREFEGDTIKHTLATLLLNEQGRIIHRVDGSTWDVQEFLGKMRKG